MINGVALDIGGSRIRCYWFKSGLVSQVKETWLPKRFKAEETKSWAERRVEAIVDFIDSIELHELAVATACAGRKNEALDAVVESFYGSPLPELAPRVFKKCGIKIDPLLDDDVCAAWGHIASPRGGLDKGSPDTILLTSGTGVAESLWVKGGFRPKGSFPRLSELGLEDELRASAWRDGPLPLASLERLVEARSKFGDFKQVVLSGRFAEPAILSEWPDQLQPKVKLEICPLEEAPALGALALSMGAAEGPL